jgi:hypothetical protein
MVLAIFYYKSAYERTVQELEAFKANIVKLAEKQAHENEINRIKAEELLKSTKLIHSKLIEGIKHDYSKSKRLDNITISNLRNSLRESITSSITMPEVDTNTIGTAESWRDNYTTLAGQNNALKQGCAITTADYNLLRGWADSACLQVGCE